MALSIVVRPDKECVTDNGSYLISVQASLQRIILLFFFPCPMKCCSINLKKKKNTDIYLFNEFYIDCILTWLVEL